MRAGVPLDADGQSAEAVVNTAAIDVLRRMPVRSPPSIFVYSVRIIACSAL